VSGKQSRWDETREIHKEYPAAYPIIGGVALVGLGIWIGSLIYANDSGYGTNLYTEFISIAVTVFIIDILNRRRDDRRRRQELIDRLLREVRSPEAVIARHALHEIRDRGMLKGENCILRGKRLSHVQWENASLEHSDLCNSGLGMANLKSATFLFALLNNANFRYAKLQQADLTAAKVNCADFVFANLEGANLSFAEIVESLLMDSLFDDANLYRANLQGSSFALSRMGRANLSEANLKDTKFINTQLDDADLSHACLAGANLEGASLTGANLDGAQFDGNTILPNKKKWNPETDLERFTDTVHKCYWRSDQELSPAYSGTLDKRFTSKDFWEFTNPYPNFYDDLDPT